MSYPEALRYLESFVNYEKFSSYPYQEALNLKRVQGFLNLVKNPERSLRFIHVAGTKGKGSTCAFITYILREAGFKTGLYTSPHLIDFRERIRILNRDSDHFSWSHRQKNGRCPYLSDFEGMISKRKLASLVDRLKPALEKYNRVSIYGALSFFEICTVLAFMYFKDEGVDLAVLETGLGGRLDATNIVEPKVCVLTPISYEHMDKLGHTLKKIAAEKAGIIKRNSIVISAPQVKEAGRVISDKCKQENAKLFLVGKDIKYSGSENKFRVTTPYADYKDLKIRLCGRHQVLNAAMALAAVSALGKCNIKVRIDSIKKGLYNTLWPGRCEVVAKNPLIILDGAQNAASAKVLKKAVQERFRYRKLILILGVSNDKDIKGIADELYALAGTVILTKANNSRATDPRILAGYFRKKDKYITNGLAEAKILAQKLAKKEDLILVTGSLFVVGEFKNDKSRLN
ncbi:MAG: bifunctional folylpolyglutamate synthase/dihydrofolate synthase [Candidatus Omnitrophica bacterium]|nr:bifunctional folylpolyglutamate synthase/dihydrofolate synthase [Candidatus Omnitrophota bacterium]